MWDELKLALKPHGKSWPLSPCVFDTLTPEQRVNLTHGKEVWELICARRPENFGFNSDGHFMRNCVTYAKLSHMLREKGIPYPLYAQFLAETTNLSIPGYFGCVARQREFIQWVKANTNTMVTNGDKVKVLAALVGVPTVDPTEVMRRVEYGRGIENLERLSLIGDQDRFSGTYLAWRLYPDYSELDTDALQKVRQSCENLRSESFRSRLYRLAKERGGYEDFCKYLEEWTFPESLSHGAAEEPRPGEQGGAV